MDINNLWSGYDLNSKKQDPEVRPGGKDAEDTDVIFKIFCVLHLCPLQRLFPERTSMLEIELNRKAW